MACARGVLFDFGGVLTSPVKDSIAAWLRREEIDPGSFSRALKSWLSRTAPEGTPIHRLETGELSTPEFDTLLAAELVRVDGSPAPTTGLLQGIFAEMTLDPAMVVLVEELRAREVKVGLLSNSWGLDFYPKPWIDEAFDAVVISAAVGMRKPHPQIFQHALELLDLEADAVVFVDDAAPNIEGARAIGLTAVLHVDAETTRRELEGLVATNGGHGHGA